ncbi:MAG: peptidoglycan-binding domain-containing protein [Acidobacteriota bacterium]
MEITKRLLSFWLVLGLVLSVLVILPADTYAGGKRRSRATATRSSKGKKRTGRVTRRRGKSSYARSRRGKRTYRDGATASTMPPERVREIQVALQEAGYYQSEPNGQYDKNTVEAMSSYQKANNFRVTGYPTAESLQKLGLTKQRPVMLPVAPNDNKDTAPPTASQGSQRNQ